MASRITANSFPIPDGVGDAAGFQRIALPARGLPHEEILHFLREAKSGDADWKGGRSWSLVYYLGEAHERLLHDAYGLYLSENGLSPTAFPSLRQLESEVVAMVLGLQNGTARACGTMTSGGTESILLAVKSYRDWARARNPAIQRPEIILPASAHPAFLKAGHYLEVDVRVVPVDSGYRADPATVEAAISDRTVALVASAPSYPQGVIDPIPALGELAGKHGIGLHVDACLGGFLLPFLEELGYPVPAFDFRVPGVTSISADLHKNGYTAKGASAVLYRDPELLRRQFFVSTDWPGGLYGSPTMAGTRPGGVIAAAWAALMAIGHEGYRETARQTMEVADALVEGIKAIDGLEIVGRPDMSVFAFGARDFDIFSVADQMSAKGWRIDRQNNPASIHMIATPNHAQSVHAFLNDLAICVARERQRPHRGEAERSKAMLYGQTTDAVVAADLDTHMRDQMERNYRVVENTCARYARGTAEHNEPRADTSVRDGFVRALAGREALGRFRMMGPAASGWRSVLERPEWVPLLEHVAIDFRSGGAIAFEVRHGRQLLLDSDLALTPTVAAFHLRHGLELALWQRLEIDEDPAISAAVRAVLAAVAAVRYLDLEMEPRRRASEIFLPLWVRSFRQALAGASTLDGAAGGLVAVVSQLLPYQGLEQRDGAADFARVKSLVAQALPLAAPTEALLTNGGDRRIRIDRRTGLNCYGCSPRPRPWAITFSSSTASSISETGYQQAEELRQRLLQQMLRTGLATAIEKGMDRARREFKRLLDLERRPGTEVIFAASGTDIELVTLHLALSNHAGPVHNIVIAPDEVGSGVYPAASGLHYDTYTPLGAKVHPSTALDGLDTSRIRTESVEIRYPDGTPVPIAELDQQVRQRIGSAAQRGAKVILHLLDSSKTGLSAPSLGCVKALQARFGDKVLVVVDAAQGRLTPESIGRYCESGFLVMLTASKFFTSPPFAGALIIPPSLAGLVSSSPFPPGYRSYFTRSEFPSCAGRLTETLSPEVNFGLLLRWQAALWEIKAFYSVPAADRTALLRRFRDAVQDILRRNPDVEPIPPESGHLPVRPNPNSWDAIQTIFSFRVYKREQDGMARESLTFEESRSLYRWLNSDLSHWLPESCTERDRVIGATQCHIGQPVRIGGSPEKPIAVLRVAAGARIVSGVYFDEGMGADSEQRLAVELRDMGIVFSKISLIIRWWNVIQRASETS